MNDPTPAPGADPADAGSGGLTPHLVVDGAAAAIDFYVAVFGARESLRLSEPGGKVGHAELLIGTSRLMLADEYPDFGARGPAAIGGTPVGLHLYVADVDASIRRAEAHGATVLRPAQDEFYGDRSGVIVDPFGHRWHLATRGETIAPDELQRRWRAMLAG